MLVDVYTENQIKVLIENYKTIVGYQEQITPTYKQQVIKALQN